MPFFNEAVSLIIYWTQLTKDTKSSGHLEESTISKPRKKRTPQEKFKIVMEGLRGDHGSIAALCNAYGITQTDFYRWRDILMGIAVRGCLSFIRVLPAIVR